MEEAAACRLCSAEAGPLPGDALLAGPGLTAHHFCLLFSSGLGQLGAEGEGLRGFLLQDIRREAKRGARLKCVYCRKKGATVGCAEPTCKKSYHVNCGHNHKALFQFYDQFKSYCREHRPVQARRPGAGRGEARCGACGEVVRRAALHTIGSPCCPATHHRACLQDAALAGARCCPSCGDSASWLEELLRMGVYHPDPGLAGPPAVEEVQGEKEAERKQERPVCHAKLCFCCEVGGRQHSATGGQWEVVGCDACPVAGIHRACGGLEPAAAWLCYVCRRRGEGRQAAAGSSPTSLMSALLATLTPEPPAARPAPAGPPRRKITAETSFTDMLGCMLDAGEGEASPGDSDYESSQDSAARRPGGLGAVQRSPQAALARPRLSALS